MARRDAMAMTRPLIFSGQSGEGQRMIASPSFFSSFESHSGHFSGTPIAFSWPVRFFFSTSTT